jgi:hypothetical protein
VCVFVCTMPFSTGDLDNSAVYLPSVRILCMYPSLRVFVFGHVHGPLLHPSPATIQDAAPLEPLRGGAGLAKKLGLKNIGMLMVLLSLLYLPRAMR